MTTASSFIQFQHSCFARFPGDWQKGARFYQNSTFDQARTFVVYTPFFSSASPGPANSPPVTIPRPVADRYNAFLPGSSNGNPAGKNRPKALKIPEIRVTASAGMTSNHPHYLQVAVASPLRRHFDYLPEAGKSALDYPPGTRVSVPFGSRKVTGMVVGHSDTTSISEDKLKPVLAHIDQHALLPGSIRQVVDWLSNYYHHPHGDTLLNTLPGELRKGKQRHGHTQCHWRISHHGLGLPEDGLKSAPKQALVLAFLRKQADYCAGEDALSAHGHKRPLLLALEKKGLVEREDRPSYPQAGDSLVAGDHPVQPPQLSAEQQNACATISQYNGQFQALLLDGITGSGKTEVYLRAIAETLSENRQALVLVPEIGLTPQTIQRFRQRFDTPIAIFHSGLTDRERLLAWNAVRDGIAGIMIGTRSAVFTPMARPGIIIVDEEHDNSYKQQDNIRYSARDTAIVRARQENIPIVLGSATPSLETLHNALNGKYQHMVLHQRAGNAKPPEIEIVDIRHQSLHEGFSDRAIAAISQALQEKQQVMVFINRRGFAPLLLCHDCGWHAQCVNCDARLTLHNRPPQLRCHHCNQQARPPAQCPRCQSSQLLSVGQGTERSSEALQALFPQFDVLRIDRDSIQGKKALNSALEKINQGQPAILVGTQMLAKGHHFPALSTVIVLDVDQGLYSPDFRGPEKTLQLLTQVAGRAGREQQPGQVLIQTHMPDHPLLHDWQESGFAGSIQNLLEEREVRTLPPFSHLATLRADHKMAGRAMEFLATAKRQYQASAGNDNGNCQLVGPMPAAMEKRAGRFRAHILLKSTRRQDLHRAIDSLVNTIERNGKSAGLRWAIDVDPQEVV